MNRVGIIGLGEAGAVYARGLANAGHQVRGFDPGPVTTPEGVERSSTAHAAVTDADAVLVFTAAALAPAIAAELLPLMGDDSIYADFTTSTPNTMRELGARPSRAAFADVAILGPVPLHGIATPLMVSGPGAERLAALLVPVGAGVEIVDGDPGDAMAYKFLRSVLMKGLASVVVEATEAGRAAGRETWVRDQIAAQLAGDGQAVIDRLLVGTRKHAVRRAQEMRDTTRFLDELRVGSEMSSAAAAALARIAAEESTAGEFHRMEA